jgi:phosphoenolpyruvate synthase/pyruvate phosphate dikinase
MSRVEYTRKRHVTAYSRRVKNKYDSFRPRSGRAQARLREREFKQKLEKLLEIDDEETFRAGLEEDFGIKPDHPKFREMLKIWRGSR